MHRPKGSPSLRGDPRIPGLQSDFGLVSKNWKAGNCGAMANKFDEHAEPDCGECGRRMAHYATLPKVHDRPSVIVFKCDHCGATIIKSKEVEA